MGVLCIKTVVENSVWRSERDESFTQACFLTKFCTSILRSLVKKHNYHFSDFVKTQLEKCKKARANVPTLAGR